MVLRLRQCEPEIGPTHILLMELRDDGSAIGCCDEELTEVYHKASIALSEAAAYLASATNMCGCQDFNSSPVHYLAAQPSCSRLKSRISDMRKARLANHLLRDSQTRLKHSRVSFPGDIGDLLAQTRVFWMSLEVIFDIPYKAQHVVHICVGVMHVLAAIGPPGHPTKIGFGNSGDRSEPHGTR